MDKENQEREIKRQVEEYLKRGGQIHVVTEREYYKKIKADIKKVTNLWT